jgi:hypothetical protein
MPSPTITLIGNLPKIKPEFLPQLRQEISNLPPPSQMAGQRPEPAAPGGILLEYVGKTGLTAVGPITGLRYRFDRPGSRIIEDSRDEPSLASVPNLRPVGHQVAIARKGSSILSIRPP